MPDAVVRGIGQNRRGTRLEPRFAGCDLSLVTLGLDNKPAIEQASDAAPLMGMGDPP